jgi:hypothetical protein
MVRWGLFTLIDETFKIYFNYLKDPSHNFFRNTRKFYSIAKHISQKSDNPWASSKRNNRRYNGETHKFA